MISEYNEILQWNMKVAWIILCKYVMKVYDLINAVTRCANVYKQVNK